MAENQKTGSAQTALQKTTSPDLRGALRRGNFPLRHSDKMPGKDDMGSPQMKQIIEAVRVGGISAVIGPRGTGKTQLAIWMAMRMVVDGAKNPDRRWGDTPSEYTTALEMFLRLRADQHNPASVAKFVRPQLLVIDEIQERGETEFEDRMLTHVIDKRYGEMKPTLLIGNLLPDQLTASLGRSVVDRIRETGTLMLLEGESFRAKKTEGK